MHVQDDVHAACFWHQGFRAIKALSKKASSIIAFPKKGLAPTRITKA